MSATADQELAELRRANAELRNERDAALAELQTRTTALAHRDREYRERIEQQSATIDVLKVMSASPGDPQPVFDLIVTRARDLCDAYGVTVYEFDGSLIHWRASTGVSDDHSVLQAVEAMYPMAPSREWGVGRAIMDRRIHRIDDLETEPGLNPVLRAITAKSQVALPLMRGDMPIGALALGSRERGGFSDSQVTLLQTFAEQAVIAITSAETYRALREALGQQTATAEVLQVINASPGDLTPVFDAMLEKAMRLCAAAFGEFHSFEGDRFVPVSLLGLPAAYAEFRRRTPPVYGPGTLAWRVREGTDVLHIADLMDEEVYRQGDPQRRAMVDLGGARSGLSVALRKDGLLRGMINIYRQEVRPFSDRQIALVRGFAAQAVIAMENARLINETREALEQQTATAEVLQVINSSPGNLAPVFDTVLEKAMLLCGAAFGSLYTYDGHRFHSAAQRGVPAAYAAYRESHPPELVGQGGLHQTVTARRAVQTADVMADKLYLDGNPNVRAMVDLGGIRTIAAAPLCKDETVLGVISIYRQEVRPFSSRQIALLENFAAQAVIAMENARLLNEQREALEQQTATAEVLQVINASPGDLAPVFEAILDKAHILCSTACGSLELIDRDRIYAVAVRGFSDSFAEILRNGDLAAHQPATGPLLRGEQHNHIIDVSQIDHPTFRRAAQEGLGTVLFTPLRKDGALLGMIASARREVRPFADKEIALLESFAAQAVIAMENARLLNELRQRQEELRVTFENMGDGVAMFDATPRLAAWNCKFQDIMDLPDGVLTERPTFPDYIRYLAERGEYGSETDPEEEIRSRVAEAGRYRANERVRPDGRVIEIRQVPVAGGGFVMVVSDITERKRNEDQIRAARDAAEEASRTIEAAYRDLKAAQASLIQAEKMASLGQLTAGIAHEIKNPLNFVNNFASLSVDLLDELKQTVAPGLAVLDATHRAEVDELTNTLASNLDKINEHGRRADGIVRGMLEHSRGSSGERREVELNALVDEALNLAYHGARAQDQSFAVTLQRELGEGIAPITLAPQDMTRVLLNLFSNGFYAARERQRIESAPCFEPTLTVSTRDLDGAVEIKVRDNGIGIPSEIKDRLFQPFFTTKPPGEGTGLGLSMSYDVITQQHGGSISVDSKVGKYSEFTVRLPRSP